MCVVALINGGSVLLLKPIVDRIFIARDLAMLWLAVAGVPLLIAGKTVASYVQNYLMSWIGQTVAQGIREDLFRRLMELPIDFHDHRHSGEILSRVTSDLTMVQAALVSVPLYLIRDSMTLAALTGSLFYLDWRFALIALAGAPLTATAFLILSRKMRRSSLQCQTMLERLTERFEESLRGIFAIQSLNYEAGAIEKFQAENDSFFSLMMRYLRATALAAPLMELCGALVAAALIFFGGTAVIEARMTPGAFFAFLGAFLSAIAPIKNLARTNSDLQRALASGERIFELLDHEPRRARGRQFAGLRQDLRLDRVCFLHPGATRQALVDISFLLGRGGSLAVVGPAGAGKTTLMRLLLLLNEPTSGRILFDGTDSRDLDPSSLRGRVGIISEKTKIFNETLWGNIALGRKDVSQEQMDRACRAAGLGEWIAAQPEGPYARLDHGGAALGAGLRKRIALARVALKSPDLLLLDEATAGLDAEGQAEFLTLLAPLLKDRAVVCAGHRLQAALGLTRVLMLADGRIADCGDHESLLARNPFYQRLYCGPAAAEAIDPVP